MRKKGETLIEVVVALGIISIALLGLFSLAILALQNSTSAKARSQATVYAQQALEISRESLGSCKTTISGGTYYINTSGELAPLTPAEAAANADVFTTGNMFRFRRTIEITDGGAAGNPLDSMIPPNPPSEDTNYLLLKTTVQWEPLAGSPPRDIVEIYGIAAKSL